MGHPVLSLIEEPAHTTAGVLHLLSQELGLVLFSYSPAQQALLSWSENISSVLGAPVFDLARDGNLFLRYLPQAERFRVLPLLDVALSGATPLNVTYPWVRPDSGQQVTLLCRAVMTNRLETPALEGFILAV